MNKLHRFAIQHRGVYLGGFITLACVLILGIIFVNRDKQPVVHDINNAVTIDLILEGSDEYGLPPVWLNADVIFLPTWSIPNVTGGHVFNLRTGIQKVLDPPRFVECHRSNYRFWSRLPDHRLGFVYECLSERLIPLARYLIALDVHTNEYEVIQQYEATFHPNEYSLSAKMDEIILETTGGDIKHKLYWGETNDILIQLFSDFYRAGSPSWSPDGQRLAFAGNDSGKGVINHIFASYVNLRNEIYLPWNLYIIEQNALYERPKNPVLTNIVFLNYVKWSPKNNNLIAFRGQYENKLGLWLFDIEKRGLFFLWPESSSYKIGYDWSPDGKQLLLLDCKKDNSFCSPTIITVPNQQ